MQGANASESILEGLADKIADAIVQGGVGIGDWVPDKGASIHVSTSILFEFYLSRNYALLGCYCPCLCVAITTLSGFVAPLLRRFRLLIDKDWTVDTRARPRR